MRFLRVCEVGGITELGDFLVVLCAVGLKEISSESCVPERYEQR